MKMLHFILVFLFAANAFAQTDTLTLLYVNDTHSTLAPLAPRTPLLEGTRGGIARAASIIGSNRMTEPNVVTLHGGDLFTGDIFFVPFFGVPELRMMSLLEFDAMGVGNHEFDLTPVILQMALDSGRTANSFPLVSSNLIMDGFPSLRSHIRPYLVKEFTGLRVGIFGITTPETNVFSLPAPVFVDTSIAGTMMAMVDSLKAKQCKVIICISHLGIENDKMLASLLPGIDVIISSHDHVVTPSTVNIQRPDGGTTYVSQAGANYSHVGKIRLRVQAASVSLLDNEMIELTQSVPEEPQIKAVVDGLISEIEQVYGPLFHQQIATAVETLEEVEDSLTVPGRHDTPIGNLITDAFRAKTHTQIAIQVGGSTAQPIFKGPVTPVDAYRAIGYGYNMINGLGYHLVTFKLTGADLQKGLEFGLSMIESNDELLPQVSGMKYSYVPANPPGERVSSILIGGNPISYSEYYSVTTNQFLFYALADTNLVGVNPVEVVIDTTSTEFAALTQHIAALQQLTPLREGRITAMQPAKIKNENARPESMQLRPNYPNPFNPTTKIPYSLAESGPVTLKVFSINGEEVATLVSALQTPGEYEIPFDACTGTGTSLPSGIYLYKLQQGANVLMRKCILLR